MSPTTGASIAVFLALSGVVTLLAYESPIGWFLLAGGGCLSAYTTLRGKS